MRNVFGDGIRIRDNSNFNVIEYNDFYKTGCKAACSSWFCLPGAEVCSKITPECPSYENIIRFNSVVGNRICGWCGIYSDLQAMLNLDCSDAPPIWQREYLDSNHSFACDLDSDSDKDEIFRE